MTTTLAKKRETLVAHAQAFLDEREDAQGMISAEDQAVFDSMIAAAKTMNRGGLRTQAKLDAEHHTIKGAGAGGKGTALVDERGRVCRALTKNESFADAVLENPSRFAANPDQQRWVDDGLTTGGFLRSLAVGPQTSAERFALSDANPTGAGVTVPQILAADIIDKFRARQVCVRAGAQTLPLDGETHTFARLTADATPSWRRETTDIAVSEQTFGAIQFQPRSLAVLVKASRELLQDAPNIGTIIERSLTEALAVEVDRVALLGAGPIEPVGLLNWPGLNETTGVGAIVDYSDFINGWKLLLDDNAPDPSAAIIANREWATLANLVSTVDAQPILLPPAIANLPFLSTSAIPTNLGGGANESFSMLGHFPDLVLGVRSELQIEVLNQLFAGQHMVGYVAHLRMDVGVFHAESFARLLGITP